MSVDRGFTWMEDETIILINLFSRSDIQEELKGAKRNITVYEKIAGELSTIGFSRTAYQCREKIKRLRKEYQHVKHCLLNNLKPKKPMKHYDLVHAIFSHSNTSEQMSATDQNLHISENEEEMQCSSHDKESDASDSFPSNDQDYPQSILPISSPLQELDCDNSEMLLEVKLTNSPLISQTDSDNNLFLNGEQSYDLSDKDSALEDIDSPWVPNVVLVENDSMKDDAPTSSKEDNASEKELKDFSTSEEKDSISDIKEPPHKKRKCSSVLKAVIENVSDNFLKFQESAESKFLEKITQLERERIKRDENMQKLWLEFEERRRKEEQQHELKILSILGQFINQMTQNNVDHKL